jgi:geranylgeranyl reductase family protein
MERCDVLIVGGGPAGSSCAWGLREAGLDVLVVDRKTFPRDKVCAGWITPQVVESLGIDLDAYRRSRVCQPITGFRTGMIGGREVANEYKRPVSYGIRRCEFDQYLLDRTAVRRCEAEAVGQIERDGDGWLVNGSIRASLVVGAGGHFCPVARMLGARSIEGSLVVAAQEIEFPANPDELARGTISAAVPELFFCPDLEGYGWCFRKGDFLNIGLGRTDREGLSNHVQAFVEFLRSRGKIACEIPARFHGHAYQLHERTQPVLCDDGVLLVGDAAGLAYPQSGEGIRPAVESGLLAAAVIAAANGDFAGDRLAGYSRLLAGRLGTPRTRGASDWLPASWLRVLAARLLASKQFARRVVIERWFLHMHDPALPPGPVSAEGETAAP